MSEKASEFLRSGPGRLATGEGGAPRVGKSAFMPEAALADLSTADDPRPQQPAEPLVARKLADEIDRSDQARADDDGEAPSSRVHSGSGEGGPEPFSAAGPAADPAATSEPGAAGGAPSASVQPALETPEPLAAMQEQIESLLEQVEVLRTALTDAAILTPPGSIEPGPVAAPAASDTTGGDGPGLTAELASARPIDPETLGASALGQAPLTVSEGLVGAPSELAGDATTIVTEPLAGAPNVQDLAASGLQALGEPLATIPAAAASSNAELVGVGEPAVDLVEGFSEISVEPLSGTVAGLSAAPAGNAILGAVEAQPLDTPETAAEIASTPLGAAVQPLDDVIDGAAETVTEVAPTSVGKPAAELEGVSEDEPTAVTGLASEISGGGSIIEPPLAADAPDTPTLSTPEQPAGTPEPVAEPQAEAPPSLESLLANVGAAIVVPGPVAGAAEPKPAPKPTTSEVPDEDDDGADFLAGTGLADDPADEEAPTGMLGGPLGGLNTPPPPDPLDF